MTTADHRISRRTFGFATLAALVAGDSCSALGSSAAGSDRYDVTFREFEGRHEMPPAIATEALRWVATVSA